MVRLAGVGLEAGDTMSMKLELSPASDFLKVRVTGEFSLAEARRTFLEMLGGVAQHKVQKVLFDGRGITGEPSTMERFYHGEFAAKAVVSFATRGVSRATRFAYVLQEPVLDSRRFGETVAVNRGMFVRAFDNLEDALAWLELVPASKPTAGNDE